MSEFTTATLYSDLQNAADAETMVNGMVANFNATLQQLGIPMEIFVRAPPKDVYCVDCTSHSVVDELDKCSYQDLIDLVTGKRQLVDCVHLRGDNSKCGKQGKWYEAAGTPKPS